MILHALHVLLAATAVCGPAPAAPAPAPERVHHVDPRHGADAGGTGAADRPFRTITRALADARAGETVLLSPGSYVEDVATVRPGVTVAGPRDAVLRGAGTSGRVFQVHHDDTTLRGFTIDGRVCADLVEACYRDKGVYVVGTVAGDGVRGTRILGMRVANLGGECVRIKYLATDSLVADNRIGPCGAYDFAVPNTGTGQNGEGIYIGTAPEQTDRNPSPEPDASNGNRVHRNVIDTDGGECVDIKEGASHNDVAFNTCTGQLPRNGNSGAMDTRGSYNTFRSNHIHHNAAAGVRIGGDRPGDAVGNAVRDNVITGNARGGIKVQDPGPQGAICGNVMHGNTGGDVVGDFADRIGIPTTPCESR
ncbi:DUF1565 domain-containing protein [Pseudonocardia kunmingensis]|uniref:Uncharacterized protein DUF1565 n=1 Tax=Pseudonocardia kunmingensis TaxID=630975 RepID=A0A543D166_9PSEU|nr:right-handed parallel beta-helix repeat-containing protein [Pseudonocardia kunmingensis]TQM03084.1 uncharacterized protein DUF1565 [Pseudonocardia kunmingensis]